MMSLVPLVPEERAALGAVSASLDEGHSDVSIHEVAVKLGGDERTAELWLDGLADRGVLERVDASTLYAGLELPPLYTLPSLEQAPERPHLSAIEDFHSFEPVESYGYPAWVQELGL